MFSTLELVKSGVYVMWVGYVADFGHQVKRVYRLIRKTGRDAGEWYAERDGKQGIIVIGHHNHGNWFVQRGTENGYRARWAVLPL